MCCVKAVLESVDRMVNAVSDGFYHLFDGYYHPARATFRYFLCSFTKTSLIPAVLPVGFIAYYLFLLLLTSWK